MKRFFLLLPLILLAAGTVAFWTWRELHTPRSHTKEHEYIEIARGSSSSEIVDKLDAAGVIGRRWPLLLYLKFSGASAKLKAGEYRFPSPISPLEVVKKLQESEQRLNRFTVIEGWTRWDIATAMAKIPDLQLIDANQALELMNDTSLISDLDPEAGNLEGYLYPDTYSFSPDTTPAEMIAFMVKRFRREWQPEWSERARSLGKTPREIVTIASLIETEAKLKEERPLVASVIYNRLGINMPLGIDSSVIYAAKLAGKWKNDGKVYKSDVERVSPYNTRLQVGLPPGPIAQPSRSALEAALDPAQTDYLYYVRDPARDDGAHNFYHDATDFERGVQALRDWERNRDAKDAKQAASANDSSTN